MKILINILSICLLLLDAKSVTAQEIQESINDSQPNKKDSVIALPPTSTKDETSLHKKVTVNVKNGDHGTQFNQNDQPTKSAQTVVVQTTASKHPNISRQTEESIVFVGNSGPQKSSSTRLPTQIIKSILFPENATVHPIPDTNNDLPESKGHLETLEVIGKMDLSMMEESSTTNMEESSTTNYAPVAIPDVYTTPENTPLVVSAPGHLSNDSDPDGDTVTWISYSLPENGTVSNTSANGQFTYTPDPGFSGIESFEITITDGNGNLASGLITILVVPDQNRSPIAVPDVYTTPENTPLTVSAPGHLDNDSDPDGDTVTWVSYSLPENGAVSNTETSGQFTYTPDPGFSGIESFEVSITDGNGNLASGLITILVVPDQNRSPIVVPDSYTTPENTALTVSEPGHLGNDYDLDGDTLTWLSYTLPENGTVSNTLASGQFTYTPDPGFTGIESFEVTIADGNGNTAKGLISITVIPSEGDDPVAVADVYTTPENTALEVPAPGHLGNDFDPNEDTITWVSYTIPVNGTVSNTQTNGQFTYTPDPGFSGIESFEITISDDNGNTASGLITILVIPDQNRSPIAVPDVYTTPENIPLIVSAPGHLDNDSDPDGDTVSWISYSIPENGEVSNTEASGQFTYTPDPGFSGIESFEVTITDGKGNVTSGLITILVIPDQNRAPVSVPDVYTTREGISFTVPAPGHLGNDYDPDGDTVTWVSYTLPDNGTVSGTNSDGQFTYSPDPGFSGIESFSVSITDGNGNVAQGLIVIAVLKNNPPVANAGEDQTVIIGQTVALDGTGSSDPDGNTLTYQWMFAAPDASDPVPSGSSALLTNAETANPSFTADLPGEYHVKLVVNDGFVDSDPDYVTIDALSIIEGLDLLLSEIEELALDGTINKGLAKALTSKIKLAKKQLNMGNPSAAGGSLTAFINQVMALYQGEGILSEEQAMSLAGKAKHIFNMISGQSDLSEENYEDFNASRESTSAGENQLGDYLDLNEPGFQIYPNPFRTSSEIAFNLPVASEVRIVVYDMNGKEIVVLKEGYYEAGHHTVTFSGDGLKNGTYNVRMMTDHGFTETKRVVFMK